MSLIYDKTEWKDDKSTPINARNLNNIEDGIEYIYHKWDKIIQDSTTGDHAAELIDARYGPNDTEEHPTLGHRLNHMDNKFQDIRSQLEHIKNEKPYINALSYGAKGDGITIDSPSLNLALDYLRENGGGKLFIPKGEYIIKEPLFVPSNTVIEGEAGTTLKRVDDFKAEQWLGYGLSASLLVGGNGKPFNVNDKGSNIVISNLKFDGNKDAYKENANTKNIPISNIQFNCCDNVRIEYCDIQNAIKSGVYISSCNNVSVTNNKVCNNGLNSDTAMSKNGISFHGYDYLNDKIVVEKNEIYNNKDEGINFECTKTIHIKDNIIYGNGDKGIEGDNSTIHSTLLDRDCFIVNNKIYSNAKYAIGFAGQYSRNINIESNIIHDHNQLGIYVNSANANVKVLNNDIKNCTGNYIDGVSNDYVAINVINAIECNILNNTLTNGNGFAISLNNVKKVNIDSNVISNFKQRAMLCADIPLLKINLNNFENILNNAIQINSNAINSFNTINMNTILNSSDNTEVVKIRGSAIKHLDFSKNNINDTRTTTMTGKGLFIELESKIETGHLNMNTIKGVKWTTFENDNLITNLVKQFNIV